MNIPTQDRHIFKVLASKGETWKRMGSGDNHKRFKIACGCHLPHFFERFLVKGIRCTPAHPFPCNGLKLGQEPKTMKISKTRNWLSKALFNADSLGNPILLTIADFESEETPKGTTHRLVVTHESGKIFAFDVFGDALNSLIDQLGDETDTWKSRKIKVMLLKGTDGKDKKTIQVLP